MGIYSMPCIQYMDGLLLSFSLEGSRGLLRAAASTLNTELGAGNPSVTQKECTTDECYNSNF